MVSVIRSTPPNWSKPFEIQFVWLLLGVGGFRVLTVAGGVTTFREGLAVGLAVGLCFAEFTDLVSVAFALLAITEFRDTVLAVGLAVGFCFAEFAHLVPEAFLFSGATELRGTGVASCDCFGRLAVCPGVLLVVWAVVGFTLDWPRLLLDWLGFDWVFGLLFFLPGFPDFALASVPMLLAPCMIPEIPAETPDVAVSIKLSLTLRTPETTDPAAPNSPVKNPPELSLVGVLGELVDSLGTTDSWGVLVLFV